jgi:hypothetical protein
MVLWLRDGLRNARIGVSPVVPVQPSTRARRNLQDSCVQPAQLVVWSMMIWLVGGQTAQDHVATKVARPVLGRREGPRVVIHGPGLMGPVGLSLLQ